MADTVSMATTVPCVICKLPAEAVDEHTRWGAWCEACFEDSSALGTAMLLCQSGEDAKGHWFYFQEWLRSKERANAQQGLTNCDRCGFLMRLPYPIGDSKLCVHCVKGRTVATEEGVAFLRIPQPLYLSLNKELEAIGLDWGQMFKFLDWFLPNPNVKAKIKQWASEKLPPSPSLHLPA